jgi:hypothetical protein
VDEAERQLPITLTQQTVFVVQCFAKIAYAIDKVLTAFAIMMKMDFHVRNPVTNHFGQGFHQARMIFLFRKEKGISRRVTNRVGLTSPCNLRPSDPPWDNARLCGAQINATPLRLVMVRNGHPDTLKPRRGRLRNLPQALSDVRRAPNLRIVD